MPLRVFLPYDVVGAGAWATTFCVLGYVFWQSFDRLTQYVSRGLFAFGTVVALGVALYLLVRLRRDAELREKVKAWLREREDNAARAARCVAPRRAGVAAACCARPPAASTPPPASACTASRPATSGSS